MVVKNLTLPKERFGLCLSSLEVILNRWNVLLVKSLCLLGALSCARQPNSVIYGGDFGSQGISQTSGGTSRQSTISYNEVPAKTLGHQGSGELIQLSILLVYWRISLPGRADVVQDSTGRGQMEAQYLELSGTLLQVSFLIG